MTVVYFMAWDNLLTDRFGRRHTQLCVSLPARGRGWKSAAHQLATPEIIRLATLFAGLGIETINLTGLEPLLYRDITYIVSKIATIGWIRTLAMTTGAAGLPGNAAKLKNAGLNALTVNLKPEFFARQRKLQDAQTGIDEALAAGLKKIKVNVIVAPRTDDAMIFDFADWCLERHIDMHVSADRSFASRVWPKPGAIIYADIRSRMIEKYAHGERNSRISFSEKRESADGGLLLTENGVIRSGRSKKSLRDVIRAGGSDEDLARTITRTLYAGPVDRQPPSVEGLIFQDA